MNFWKEFLAVDPLQKIDGLGQCCILRPKTLMLHAILLFQTLSHHPIVLDQPIHQKVLLLLHILAPTLDLYHKNFYLNLNLLNLLDNDPQIHRPDSPLEQCESLYDSLKISPSDCLTEGIQGSHGTRKSPETHQDVTERGRGRGAVATPLHLTHNSTRQHLQLQLVKLSFHGLND